MCCNPCRANDSFAVRDVRTPVAEAKLTFAEAVARTNPPAATSPEAHAAMHEPINVAPTAVADHIEEDDDDKTVDEDHLAMEAAKP